LNFLQNFTTIRLSIWMAPILVVPRPIVTDTSVVDAAAAVDHPVIAEVAAMPTIVIGEVADVTHDHAADLHARAEDAALVIVIVWSAALVTRSVIVSMNVSGERRGCQTLKRIISVVTMLA